MKILHADDHPIVCTGIGLLLETHLKDTIVLKANTFQVLLDILKQHDDIDLVLLDLFMPEMENNYFKGLDTLLEIKRTLPIVILSASENIQIIRSMMEAGAKGYIPKSARGEVIIHAVKLVLAGGRYLPELLLLESQPATRGERQKLSIRQREILTLVAQGYSTKHMANYLHISESTVKAHIRDILKSLNARTRTEAVVKAAHLLGEILK